MFGMYDFDGGNDTVRPGYLKLDLLIRTVIIHYDIAAAEMCIRDSINVL